ncbi:MAG: bifunctional UDP-N-acetylglucosamine diphosphorylase/glucosamine-1-phosphate N-acetyltransferase GlmU, partial [Woeseiaceae bacterium]|nr:bifunctional UDP-N-acetylglucosamine diphosphorylase/glucosamine-1-phosphate N-acetyltransferase GlmU [Woeseiaceae bacterium]
MGLSVIILAAGQGTRMRSDLPKVLQSLAGQPLLAHVLDCSRELGADAICVVYGHGAEEVQARFPDADIRWALQEQQLGTGHAVQQAMQGTPDDKQVLILFGDVPLLRPATLVALVHATGEDELSVLTVDMDDPTGYGRIVRDGDNVSRIVEEKDATDDEKAIVEINTGVMLCKGERLRKWLANLDNANTQGEYYLTDVISMAVADGLIVHGIKAQEQVEVMGINDKKQLAEAERALQARLVDELMAQGVGFADPARVDIRGTLSCGKDVFIDVNAVFEGEVSLGDGVRIESNNLIRDSQLGASVVVHSNCHIEGAT